MLRKTHLVVLIGDQGAGKVAIAREAIKQIPDATMVVKVTTLAPSPSHIKGEYRYAHNIQYFDSWVGEGKILWPDWDGGNKTGIDRASLLSSVLSATSVGFLVLKHTDKTISLLTDLQNFLSRGGVDLNATVKLIFVVRPDPGTLEQRLWHKADLKAELARRTETPADVNAYRAAAMVPVWELPNDGTLDQAVARLRELIGS
jgi:guanylate kinase